MVHPKNIASFTNVFPLSTSINPSLTHYWPLLNHDFSYLPMTSEIAPPLPPYRPRAAGAAACGGPPGSSAPRGRCGACWCTWRGKEARWKNGGNMPWKMEKMPWKCHLYPFIPLELDFEIISDQNIGKQNWKLDMKQGDLTGKTHKET